MKTVLVTGAAAGLGHYLTLSYVKKGYTVFALDIDEKNLQNLPKENILPIKMDISSPADWDTVVVPEIEKLGKGLDIVIACASVMHLGSAETCPEAEWNKVNSINLTGQYLTAKKTLPFLQQNKGNILFIGSPSGLLAVPDEVCYVTFKHAVRGLSKSVAIDFGSAGIRANVVHPGWMRTVMSDKEMEEIMAHEHCSLDEAYLRATRFVPLRRPGDLEEIWNAIDFLTSDKASYITGAELTVDGGLTVVDPGMVAFER